ncbi:MAG: hypothetical protein Q4A28_03260 [Brachymonas sp.]|nr:hypothetical protein [Brachymonas sp.]
MNLVLAAHRLDRARALWRKDFGDKPMRREYRVYSAYLLRQLGRCADGVKAAKTNADMLEALHLSFPANGAAEAMRRHESRQRMEGVLLWDAAMRELHAEQKGVPKPKADYEKLAKHMGLSVNTLMKESSMLGLSPKRSNRADRSTKTAGKRLGDVLSQWGKSN